MTPGQLQALDELRSVQETRPGAIRILAHEQREGYLVVKLSIDCRGFERKAGGVRLRARERFKVLIPPGFPFDLPVTFASHTRWRDAPHVQWRNRLCLYLSTEAEWNPSDGMYGFLERLLIWLRAASTGELDPRGVPVHPPVAYPTSEAPTFVPRADTPIVGTNPWLGLALLERRSDHRFDIVGWTALDDLTAEDLDRTPFAVALLLNDRWPFEYPDRLRPLLSELLDAGIPLPTLIQLLSLVRTESTSEHVHIVVGTPMRGIVGDSPLQHLAVWRIESELADQFRESLPDHSDGAALATARSRFREALMNAARVIPVEWCPVREARPEATQPRDEGSPVQWWQGRTVEVWGCGALGGAIAEHLCRAGVGRLVLRDNSAVSPGVIERQNFEDEDIGRRKVDALAARLKRIRPDLDVATNWTDLIDSRDLESDWSNGADVVLDATAVSAVSKRIELLRKQERAGAVLVGTMIGHQARRGLVVTCKAGATGATTDAIRKAKLASSMQPALASYADEFWPIPPRTDLFFPEPGCSDPTFTGSDAEVKALASTMFLIATEQIARDPADMTASFVSLPTGGASADSVALPIQPDLLIKDAFEGYEVRVSASAAAEMRAWIRRSGRISPGSETGGVLYGERDDALRIIWVSDILGPPPDSEASAHGFVCGTEGVDAATMTFSTRSRDSSRPIGMWHTHPDGDPVPSPTDFEGMDTIIRRTDRSLPKQLLIIVGGTESEYRIGAYLYNRYKPYPSTCIGKIALWPDAPAPKHKIGLSLSGGGFRAVAFHLGVLRALHDRGVLEHLDVLSTVSGGSLIGAMWAYSDDDFTTFDRRVTALLFSRLNWRIIGSLFASKKTPAIVVSAIASAIGSATAATFTVLRRLGAWLMRRPPAVSAEPFPRQWMNRSAAVQHVFDRILGSQSIAQPKRNLAVVINACDLRSASAFRFGSAESGCWRYGRMTDNDIPVALAVAASAAYPVALPAIDAKWQFTKGDGRSATERLLITDGGVFDNLGTSCLEPRRNPKYSTNVYPVDYIIAADAGYGLLDANRYPLWWPARMRRAFETVYRRAQAVSKGQIFLQGDVGNIRGFVLPFLGQIDEQLRTIMPPDFVTRDEVVGYPTNFSKMRLHDIEAIAKRGEQLTRMLIEAHVPEVV